MSGKTWLIVGAILGALSVGSGAFGAHWLKDEIPKWYAEPELQVKRLGDWETAARYQMYHALAIIAVGLAMGSSTGRMWNASAICFMLGTAIFSGSLYCLVISTNRLWGAVTPVGGLLMILGWVLFALAAAQKRG